ncbi:uncharacterized protein LOC132060769 [Lycium ferocissimum]|uniref:uncharacterized protein LOC132060769 n=1 Tax=Lycium ferocissimum TaxID=112874 RepID=UPI0028149CC3|nr:uncharacterized protein LOC132060769 [Lycium ferocissimum]
MRQCYHEQRTETIGIESRKKGLWIEEEEEEDSLSLSDLSINDIDSEEWEKYYDSKSSTSSSSTSSSSHSPDEDIFEFNSNKNNAGPPENILFCGKLIRYSNPMSPNDDQNKAKMPDKRSRSLISLSSRKSWRWYIFLFGKAGFPTELELKDLKNRQSRKVASSSTGKGKGMWPLIKALSCSGGATYHTQSVVKASVNGCISLV